MAKFKVAVTGDGGTDVYTRYIPGYTSDNLDDFHAKVAFDLHVPSGANLAIQAFRHLLSDRDVHILDRVPKPDTLPQSLRVLDAFPWKDTKVVRISSTSQRKVLDPAALADYGHSANPKGAIKEAQANCLVIHDATAAWRNSKAAEGVVKSLFQNRPGPSSPDDPSVLVILGDRIPELQFTHAGKATIHGKHSPVWTQLWKHKENVVILCSLTPLRHAGAAISRRLSWEQIVEDALADINHFKPLQALSAFRHLIMRVGFVGALHVDMKAQLAQLVFAPNARAVIFRDDEDGQIVGRNTVIAACLLQQIMNRSKHPRPKADDRSFNPEDIESALKNGLTINMGLFDRGYVCPSSLAKFSGDARTLGAAFLKSFFSNDKIPLTELVSSAYDELARQGRISRDRVFGRVDVSSLMCNTDKPKTSQILRSQIRNNGMSRINVGIAICRFGHQQVLNRPLDHRKEGEGTWEINATEVVDILQQPECLLSANEMSDENPLESNTHAAMPHPTSYQPRRPAATPLYVPVLEFGDLVAIERDEIESFRSIRNLIKLYVESPSHTPFSDRPISIAVFGAPGSGKSFAIKQIAKSINDSLPTASHRLETIECNVAQFRTVEDLGHAITRIASLNNQRKTPLVFFDEFDCAFENKALGWLKYFLAPMQDGTFYGASQTISFGRAVFVFAGGIYKSIYEFDPVAQPPRANHANKDQSQHELLFHEQKGPDFVSRLRGHINILSVNPDDTAVKDDEGKPVKPIIRRALTLRGQIMAANLVVARDKWRVANIDGDILYALLTVDSYRHGTRSMESILQMCTPIDGVIEKASLPSRAQLNMYVDADEFFIRLHRGRFRRYLEPAECVTTGGIRARAPALKTGHQRRGTAPTALPQTGTGEAESAPSASTGDDENVEDVLRKAAGPTGAESAAKVKSSINRRRSPSKETKK